MIAKRIYYHLLTALQHRKYLFADYPRRKHRRTYKALSVSSAPVGSFFEAHSDCYLAEAKAIIQGKHWEGKNKCVKLPGD